MPTHDKRNYELLKGLGLSQTAVQCYASLANDGGAKASIIAKRLGLLPSGLYRVLAKLERQGFIMSIQPPVSSRHYYARPLNKAFPLYIKHQKRAIAPLLGGYENHQASYLLDE